MSLCSVDRTRSNSVKKTLPEKTLSKYACSIRVDNLSNETPLCARRGSFTLEAAVIIPLVAGFLAVILMWFRVLQVETQVYSALSYASRKTAAMTAAAESEAAELAMAEAYFRSALSEYELPEDYVKGGAYGISLLSSDFSGDYVCLEAVYRISFPVPFFRVSGISIFQESSSRKWIGSDGSDAEDDPWVYVTETGSVYHLTAQCSYLDLSVKTANYAEIQALRNKNGHKYYACELCAADISANGKVYITDYGTVYHTDMNCSGLKRTVYQVRLSEVGGKAACSKCGVK